MIPASSCISYVGVLARVPPRGSDYTGSSEKALINATAFKGGFSQCHSKQSAQSGSAHPAQIPSWLSEELRAGPCWGQGRDGGWDLLMRDCEKAVTHAYACPSNPSQNIYILFMK